MPHSQQLLHALQLVDHSTCCLGAAPQVGGGVRAIQVREVEISGSVTACFFLLHDDGSEEDVSYRKVGRGALGLTHVQVVSKRALARGPSHPAASKQQGGRRHDAAAAHYPLASPSGRVLGRRGLQCCRGSSRVLCARRLSLRATLSNLLAAAALSTLPLPSCCSAWAACSPTWPWRWRTATQQAAGAGAAAAAAGAAVAGAAVAAVAAAAGAGDAAAGNERQLVCKLCHLEIRACRTAKRRRTVSEEWKEARGRWQDGQPLAAPLVTR